MKILVIGIAFFILLILMFLFGLVFIFYYNNLKDIWKDKNDGLSL